jgi:hypothetical protein
MQSHPTRACRGACRLAGSHISLLPQPLHRSAEQLAAASIAEHASGRRSVGVASSCARQNESRCKLGQIGRRRRCVFILRLKISVQNSKILSPPQWHWGFGNRFRSRCSRILHPDERGLGKTLNLSCLSSPEPGLAAHRQQNQAGIDADELGFEWTNTAEAGKGKKVRTQQRQGKEK